jgi:hypothetical protein
MQDVFRPHTDPARRIYDAFQAEAEKRATRQGDEWIAAERLAVWHAARDYAQQHGLRIPTIDEVACAENNAMGHCDYGAKWAYRVAEYMRGTERGDD